MEPLRAVFKCMLKLQRLSINGVTILRCNKIREDEI